MSITVVKVMNRPNMIFSCSTFAAVLLFSIFVISFPLSFGAYIKAPLSPTGPTIKDDNLTVEKVTDGLNFPTSMAFLGPNDILVTEKETGKVMRIIDSQVQNTPVLDVSVANSIERGTTRYCHNKTTIRWKNICFSLLYGIWK